MRMYNTSIRWIFIRNGNIVVKNLMVRRITQYGNLVQFDGAGTSTQCGGGKIRRNVSIRAARLNRVHWPDNRNSVTGELPINSN
jgi:hypothetical protein